MLLDSTPGGHVSSLAPIDPTRATSFIGDQVETFLHEMPTTARKLLT